MTNKKNVHLVRAESYAHAEMIQSLLEANGILSMRKSRYLPGASVGIFTAGGSTFGIDIYVLEEDVNKAKEIIRKENVTSNEREEKEGTDSGKEDEDEKKKEKISRLFFFGWRCCFSCSYSFVVFSNNIFND